MRAGDRLEFRNLRCTGKYVRELKSRSGVEYTQWNYRFHGTDGRTYYYNGRHYQVEPGSYIDFRATVERIRNGLEVWLKRPKMLEPIDGPDLFG